MNRELSQRYWLERAARWTAVLTVLAVVAVVAGCGGEPFDIVPVSGKVTYKGGEAIPGDKIDVTFHPQVEAKGKEHPRLGHAILNKDGSFDSVTTHKHADGLIRGKHKVTLQAFDEKENPLPGVIPDKYTDPKKTPLEIEVKGSGKLEPMEIDKP